MNLEPIFYDQRPPDRGFGPTVLIADDGEPDRNRLKEICSEIETGNAIHIITSSNIEETFKILTSVPVHVVLLDRLFKKNGIEFDALKEIPKMIEIQPHVQILVITGTDASKDAVAAMRMGACGYVTKDKPRSLIFEEINRAISVSKLTIDQIRSERSSTRLPSKTRILGESKIAKRLESQIQAVAESRCPVLLLGPPGTGKTTIAKMIHERRQEFLKETDRPYFCLHLGSMAPTLIESELFGYEKGAFNGAVKSKQGFCELVNWGTLVLDEIGEITPDLQIKLLKVLGEKKFFRVGGTKEFTSTFKLVCATNQDLEELVALKRFREDLFMRISTFIIKVPGLKDRLEDIPAIIRGVLPECCADTNTFIEYEDLPQDFIDEITSQPPRGEIRGIQHTLTRLLLFSKDRNGRVNLGNWRENAGLNRKKTFYPKRNFIQFDEVTQLPFDVVPANENMASNFQGLPDLLEKIADGIVMDAKRKFKTQTDIAKALKISKSSAHYRLKRLEKIDSTFVETTEKLSEEKCGDQNESLG